MGTSSKGKYIMAFCEKLTKKDKNGKQEKVSVAVPTRTRGAFGKCKNSVV